MSTEGVGSTKKSVSPSTREEDFKEEAKACAESVAKTYEKGSESYKKLWRNPLFRNIKTIEPFIQAALDEYQKASNPEKINIALYLEDLVRATKSYDLVGSLPPSLQALVDQSEKTVADQKMALATRRTFSTKPEKPEKAPHTITQPPKGLLTKMKGLFGFSETAAASAPSATASTSSASQERELAEQKAQAPSDVDIALQTSYRIRNPIHIEPMKRALEALLEIKEENLDTQRKSRVIAEKVRLISLMCRTIGQHIETIRTPEETQTLFNLLHFLSRNAPKTTPPLFGDPIESAYTKLKEKIGLDSFKKLKDGYVEQALNKTPPFKEYKVILDAPDTPVSVLALSTRPADYFIDELLKDTDYTKGKDTFFSYCHKSGTPLTYQELRTFGADIRQKPADTVVHITAKGKPPVELLPGKNLQAEAVYGTGTYALSYREIDDILDSQKIYMASGVPAAFFIPMKQAISEANLLGAQGARHAVPDSVIGKTTIEPLKTFVQKVRANPQEYGFASSEEAEAVLQLHYYEFAPLIIKEGDFHIFTDEHGKIIDRKVGEKTSIKLIDFCGFRTGGDQYTDAHKAILEKGYETILSIIPPDGYVIIPAVGMGVWRGNPKLYWDSFFEALKNSPSLPDTIFINTGGKESTEGYRAALQEYQKNNPGDQKASKIKLLQGKDIVHFARQLRIQFPDTYIGLVNASDPDVILGDAVGEYVNRRSSDTTTEENYAAIGSSLINFEGISHVREGRMYSMPTSAAFH